MRWFRVQILGLGVLDSEHVPEIYAFPTVPQCSQSCHTISALNVNSIIDHSKFS